MSDLIGTIEIFVPKRHKCGIGTVLNRIGQFGRFTGWIKGEGGIAKAHFKGLPTVV